MGTSVSLSSTVQCVLLCNEIIEHEHEAHDRWTKSSSYWFVLLICTMMCCNMWCIIDWMCGYLKLNINNHTKVFNLDHNRILVINKPVRNRIMMTAWTSVSLSRSLSLVYCLTMLSILHIIQIMYTAKCVVHQLFGGLIAAFRPIARLLCACVRFST